MTTVYRCGWRVIRGEVEVWLLTEPRIRVVTKSFFLAEKRLRRAILETFDDWSPYLAFWPLRPPKAKEELRYCDDWLLLEGTSPGIAASVAMSELFEGGMCPKCETPKGERTSVSLSFPFESLKGVDLGTVKDKAGSRRVVSEVFIRSFIGPRRGAGELLPCTNTGIANPPKKYFEVLPKSPVRAVAIKHERAEIWKCCICGKLGVPNLRPVGSVRSLAKRSELEKVKGDWAFYVDFWNHYGVAVRKCFVKPLEDQPGLTGVDINWLGLVDDSEVWKGAPVRMIEM
jgi:hypothetical protein